MKAFRRTILDIYDHQCTACGLRIRLPAGADVSFIDAAHPLSVAKSRPALAGETCKAGRDPTNGLALCKNHPASRATPGQATWAMDRKVMAPGTDHRWLVSKVIDPRRSNGEEKLSELAGKTLLLPKDRAFYPDDAGLEWRTQNLVD